MKPRTSQQIDEDLAKTLYVRLPRTIKSADQVKELFLGDIKVRMPRQSSRYCHVVFPSVDEKMKNLKNIKKLVIDGKHIIACPPKINPPGERKKKEKKIIIPKPKPEPKITKTLFISNVKPGTKAKELVMAFPGCKSMSIFQSKNGNKSKAIAKFESVQIAEEYLRKEREWPEVNGNRLVIKSDTRKRKRATKKKKPSDLKIYNDETESTASKEKLNRSDDNASTKLEKRESESSEFSEDYSEEDEEEANDSEVGM